MDRRADGSPQAGLLEHRTAFQVQSARRRDHQQWREQSVDDPGIRWIVEAERRSHAKLLELRLPKQRQRKPTHPARHSARPQGSDCHARLPPSSCRRLARRSRGVGRLGCRWRRWPPRQPDIHEAEEPADPPSGLEPVAALGIDDQHDRHGQQRHDQGEQDRDRRYDCEHRRDRQAVLSLRWSMMWTTASPTFSITVAAPLRTGSTRAPFLSMTTTATGLTPPPPPEPPP
jgi:hypothetical protein